MSYLDATIPPDTEGVKLGASRIRALKTSLNTIVAKIFDDSGSFLAKWIDGSQIQNDPTTDGSRAITSDHIKNTAVILRHLVDGILTADTTGRAKMADSYITLAKLLDGLLTANTAGRAKMADGFITALKIATGTFTADTAGRLPFAAGFVTSALLDPAVAVAKAFITFSPTGFTTKAVTTTVSTSTDQLTVVSHGLTAAVSEDTVQPVAFTKTGVADGAALGDLMRGQRYFARVVDANTISLHNTSADAFAGTNKVDLTQNMPASVSMVWIALPFYHNNADVVPILGTAGGTTKGTGSTVIGYKVAFKTAFSAAHVYTPALAESKSDTELAAPALNFFMLKNQTTASVELLYVQIANSISTPAIFSYTYNNVPNPADFLALSVV